MTLTTRLARSLRRAIAPAAMSLGLMTGAASAAPVDFEFTVKTWSYGLNGGTGSDLPGIQGGGFTYGGRDVYFSGLFFRDASQTAVFSLTPRTYGPADLPSAFKGSAIFASGFSPRILVNVDGGNIGFQTAAGNYGYVVFDWNAITATLTFLSGQYESTPNVAIAVAAVPVPAALPLMLGGIAGLGLLARRKRAA